MIATLSLIFVVCGTLGYGAATLGALKILNELPPFERPLWSFAIGIGILGWIVTLLGFVGCLNQFAFLVILIIPLPALWLLRINSRTPEINHWGVLLLLVLAFILALDVIEAFAPPSDADTLAYHLALPKQFLAAGSVVLVPRALDGIAPLLIQMTYTPIMALGGEFGVTLWTMLSNWFVAALLLTFALRFVNFNWALALTLVYLTIPAVIYGGGSGQVEVRNALFALTGAMAVGMALKTGLIRYAITAGLLAGFFAGAKLLGVLFVAVAGMTIILQRKWLSHGLAYGFAALVAGSAWYIWIWAHTGDPLFPMLFNFLEIPDGPYWSKELDVYFKEKIFPKENLIDRNLWNFFTYPFVATLDPPWVWEAKRTGFGPFGLLILPFAVAGFWRHRSKINSTLLFGVALITGLYFLIWFFMTPIERIRLLLPLLPGLLLCMTVAAVKCAKYSNWETRALGAAFALSITVQSAGAALFTTKAAQYSFSNESREEYLQRTVSRSGPVFWLNKNLSSSDKVLHLYRQYNYLLEVPYFFANSSAQRVVELFPSNNDTSTFLDQVRNEGINFLLLPSNPSEILRHFLKVLTKNNCLKSVHSFSDVIIIGSRTLETDLRNKEVIELYRLVDKNCRINN
jgi:hypothetical protein